MIALGVHALPIAFMVICHQFTHLRRPLKRFAFECGLIILNQIKKVGLDDEITAINPTLASLSFFSERNYFVAFHFQFSKTRYRVDCRHSYHFSVATVKIK